MHFIDEAKTSNEAWETLEKMFGAKAKHSKISLKMQLYGLTLNDNEDLSSLVNRLKSMCTQLVYLNAPMEEEDKVAILLKSLPPSYHHLVTVLKEKDPPPTLEDVVNSLQAKEKKMHIDSNTST